VRRHRGFLASHCDKRDRKVISVTAASNTIVSQSRKDKLGLYEILEPIGKAALGTEGRVARSTGPTSPFNDSPDPSNRNNRKSTRGLFAIWCTRGDVRDTLSLPQKEPDSVGHLEAE
jgi:hypothetical protein